MALVLAHRDAKGLLLLHEKRPYNPFCVIFPQRSEIATLRVTIQFRPSCNQTKNPEVIPGIFCIGMAEVV